MLAKYFEYASVSPVSSAVLGIAVLIFIIYFIMKDKGLPPGPMGLPLLGIYPFLKNETFLRQMEDLGKKYGDIFSFRMTGHLYINLGSIKALREAHVAKSEYFAGRFTAYNLLRYTFAEGLAFSNGEPWKVYRKFFVQVFRDHGMTSIKKDMAGPIYDTVNSMIEELRDRNGKPINIIDFVSGKCSSVIIRMLFKDNCSSEEEMTEFNKAYEVVLDGMAGVRMFIIGELARRVILPLTPGYRATLANHERMLNIASRMVSRSKALYVEGEVRDIVDTYLTEREERRRKNDPTSEYFTDSVLSSTLIQILGDGTLTVAFFVGCFIQALIEHPEEQDKIYQELTEVVGPERQPSVEDKSQLPYTNAFISEVIRTTDFFPLFPGLQCSKETTLRGYRIPKGAITCVNFWAVNHDPTVYENPYEFNPSRFTTTPGKPKPEHPLLFGVGKRSCIGEPFAMIMAFLFLTTIVKNFQLTLPEDSDFARSSLFLMPGKIEVCAKLRTYN